MTDELTDISADELRDDALFRERMTALGDERAMDWIQQKSFPFIRLMSYYRCAMMEMETKLNVLNEEYMLSHDRNPISSIKTRLKSLPSIKNKLDRQGLPYTLTAIERNLTDIAGVRVICSFPEDVYALVDALMRQDDIEILAVKDYIKNPKPNGYRSLHMIVSLPIFLAKEKRNMKVEIQLRTIAMDFWASLEHQLRYKKDVVFTEEMAAELQACAAVSADLDRRMQALRSLTQSNAPKPISKMNKA